MFGYRADNVFLPSLIALNGLNHRAHKLRDDWDLMTFGTDISAGRRRVVNAMIIDRTARRADIMIGSHATGDAALMTGHLTSKIWSVDGKTVPTPWGRSVTSSSSAPSLSRPYCS